MIWRWLPVADELARLQNEPRRARISLKIMKINIIKDKKLYIYS